MLSRVKRNDKIGFLFFLAFVLATSLIWLFEERFDQDLWQNQPSMRYKLADDLIESELLIDKTKAQVIELLGEPTSTVGLNKESFFYKLGKPPSFLESKVEVLHIVFENEKVIEVNQLDQ